MNTFVISLCCTLLLASLLSPFLHVVALDSGADCLSDCAIYGQSPVCSCEELGESLVKRRGSFPFRYGKRGLAAMQKKPFRYGKRQFRYGKRVDAAARFAADLFGYNARRAGAYDHLSAEEK